MRPHHLLYHIYIAPFAYWGGIGGAKLGQALVIGGIFAATWLLLRRLRIRPAWLWLIGLLALSSPFVYRMMMVRALFTRRYRWLLPLAFALQALMENSPGMLLALVAGVLAPSLRKSRRDAAETALLLCALVTLYMTFESRRFTEYAPIFALLFAAAALGRSGIDWAMKTTAETQGAQRADSVSSPRSLRLCGSILAFF